jgi:hypothetical protein
MGNLNVQPIPFNDLDITNTGYNARVIKRYKSIRVSGEMSGSQFSQQEPLRRLNGPHILPVNK